ncbi:LysR substrate-binding domain-containing protein [Komagataeibacter rhaeticus]|nr:LysR substrate-binding domain-containing protein [Komagataeibacter rhaeticus]
MKANDSEALLEATLSEIGLALLPSWLIGEDIKAGKLVRVLGQFEWVLAPGAERAIWAVYPQESCCAESKSFINFMARQLKDSLG